MRVGVGSGNPVKRRAVATVLESDVTVESVPVPSGVADQPRGHPETIEGAETRAANVLLESPDYAYGVGIEGGVAEFDGADGLFLVMWAAVTNGERVGHGAGPSIRLPERVATRVRDGEELGPVMDDLLGTSGVAEEEGAAGALTDGRIDREAALATAVAGALGPFVTALY
jgi:inosine/xanthosine triphosphatase